MNLLLNARQAAEAGDGPDGAKVSFVAQRRLVGERRYTCLGVRDNGPGIPEQAREEIFNPYYTTRAEGTGLGLTISSRIVERHGGFIDVDSRPGETTFWVCLPEAKESEDGG